MQEIAVVDISRCLSDIHQWYSKQHHNDESKPRRILNFSGLFVLVLWGQSNMDGPWNENIRLDSQWMANRAGQSCWLGSKNGQIVDDDFVIQSKNKARNWKYISHEWTIEIEMM